MNVRIYLCKDLNCAKYQMLKAHKMQCLICVMECDVFSEVYLFSNGAKRPFSFLVICSCPQFYMFEKKYDTKIPS